MVLMVTLLNMEEGGEEEKRYSTESHGHKAERHG